MRFVRRPDHPAECRRAGDGADLPAHAERPAARAEAHELDRGSRRHRRRLAARSFATAKPLGRIVSGEALRDRLADETVTLLHPRDYNYYELLRSKLNWGRANRGDPSVPRA